MCPARIPGDVLHKELSPANQCRGTSQENFTFPAHRLYSARCMYPHRRNGTVARNRRNCRCTGPCSRGLRLSHPAFKEPRFDLTLISNHHKFHVDAVLEIMVAGNFSSVSLPSWTKLVDEDNIVRIAH